MVVSLQVLTGCLLDDGKINASLEDATVRCECTVCMSRWEEDEGLGRKKRFAGRREEGKALVAQASLR